MSRASSLLPALRTLVATDLVDSLRRFPLPCGLAGLLTVLVWLSVYEAGPFAALDGRVYGAVVALALASLGLDLVAESRGWRARRRAAAQLAALAFLLAIHFLPAPLPGPWRASDELLIPGLVLLVSVAPFLAPSASRDAFWRFNERLWLSAGLALLAAGAFALGLFAIDRSLDVLFGIDFDEHIEKFVFPLSFCFLAPLTWLAAVPRPDVATDLAPDHFLDRAVRLIARFILVPLLLTYTVILFAYTAQVVVTGELPRSQIGWMVSAFGAAGALTTLLLYPERHGGGRVLRWFCRWWFAATVVPVALLALAAWQRIDAYGVTPERYALAIGTAWLAGLAALFAWPPRLDREIRLVPGLLGALLLAGSFGPWGIDAVSLRSQVGAFMRLAQEEGWIVDGRLDTDRLPPEGTAGPWLRARSLVAVISAQGGLPTLSRQIDNPEALAVILGPDRRGRAGLAGELGVAPTTLPPEPRPVVVAEPAGPVDSRGFGRIVGPLQASAWLREGGGAHLLPEGRIEFPVGPGEQVSIDFAAHIAVQPDAPPGEPATLPAFFTARQADGSEVGVIVLEAAGDWTESGLQLGSVRLLLLLPGSE